MDAGGARPISLLLADDDDRFRRVVRSVLEDDGYVVVGEAVDALEARRLAVELDPDVVILDLVMHGADGLSAARSILADSPTRPLVVISSLFDPSVELEVGRLGAWYVEKAEGLEALEHVIDRAVSVADHHP